MNPDELIQLAESKGYGNNIIDKEINEFLNELSESYIKNCPEQNTINLIKMALIQKWLRDEYRKNVQVGDHKSQDSKAPHTRWYCGGSDMKFRDSYEEALYYGLLIRIKYL